jgi:surfactin synthase thioesterase subunit
VTDPGSARTAERWFAVRAPRPLAPVRLYCLPYAGGSAAVYNEWGAALGEGIEVCALMLPGRAGRASERLRVEPEEIAQAIARSADRPFALYGHSMGGELAFETARHLRAAGAAQPAHLFVGGCRPPDAPRAADLYHGMSQLDDSALVARLSETGGLPQEVLEVPELIELLLPVFRTDFAWLDEYVYHPQPALDVAVTAFAGTTDESASPAVMEGWRAHTAAGFALHALDGGHFFLEDRLDRLADLIRAELAGPGAGGRAR